MPIRETYSASDADEASAILPELDLLLRLYGDRFPFLGYLLQMARGEVLAIIEGGTPTEVRAGGSSMLLVASDAARLKELAAILQADVVRETPLKLNANASGKKS